MPKNCLQGRFSSFWDQKVDFIFFYTKNLFLIPKGAILVEKVYFLFVDLKPISDIQELVLSTDMYTLGISFS